MLTLAALVVLGLTPDAGFPDGFIYRDQATSSIEVDTRHSETWKITNRTFENFWRLGRPTIVRRTVVESYASMDNERYPQITLEFFVDFAPGKPADFRIERTANEIALRPDFADVITFQPVPLPENHELVDYASRKTILSCSGEYLTVSRGNSTAWVGYELEKKDPKKHGRLVMVNRAGSGWTTSEVPFTRGKLELHQPPKLSVVNTMVRLEFGANVSEVPITDGKLSGKPVGLP